MAERKKPSRPVNEICSNCLRWDQFEHKCWVFWEGKKECTHRVETVEEMNEHMTTAEKLMNHASEPKAL